MLKRFTARMIATPPPLTEPETGLPGLTDFAALIPGHIYGTHSLMLDRALVDRWSHLYGEVRCGDLVPAGMLPVVSIRAYMALLPNRPPGGIHAGQQITIHELPRIGEETHTTLECGEKEVRGGRSWVRLLMTCTNDSGRILFNGIHTAIWAA